jgi:hypothetical protein
MFLHVTRVIAVQAYEVELEFSDGLIKKVDLCNELYGEMFEPLKVSDFFKQVALNQETSTIEWPNGADFAPEFLH